MAVTINKQGLKKFVEKWTGRGNEDEDDRSYWIDLFQDVFGQTDVTDRLVFQKKVSADDGNVKRIDVYIPETNVLIEQKRLGISLDKPQAGHNGMTPYEQAKMYDNGLPRSEKARWIVTSNFEEIWIYDMEKGRPEESPVRVNLSSLDKEYTLLQFLFNPQVEQIRHELKVSQEAGDRIGRIYDSLLLQYPGELTEEEYKSLNLFCVRLVFCYYAEDTEDLFEKNQFRDYIASFNTRHLRNGLKDLFRVLDTKEDERDRTEEPALLAFKYVNGGLFSDRNIIIPQIDENTHKLMIETSDFNWADISPTIFGAVFESTLNQETRRKGGMHYTSIENIHKVIDPLFLDDLREEYRAISDMKQPNVKRLRLEEFQNKLASLKFLDPACGSGNFLTETYLSLRRLENEVIKSLIALDSNKYVNPNQISLGGGSGSDINPIKVNLSQFYGIEINDFAVAVSKAALWIAESQMLQETMAIVYQKIDFLPLKSYVNIVEGNALKLSWEEIIEPSKCSYIMGNPPFIGKKEQTKEQKSDILTLFSNTKGIGNADYVCGWYKKAADYIKNTDVLVALVSTNSITQGEQVPILWHELSNQISVFFAYRTFKWDSEALQKAHVHCVIIGFSDLGHPIKRKRIFTENEYEEVSNINPYLVDAPTILIENRGKPLCDVSEIAYGSMPIDDGHLILEKDDKDAILAENPNNSKMIRKYVGGMELIRNTERWCLWLKGISPSEIKQSKIITQRIKETADFRNRSNRPQTIALADTPSLFGEIRQPNTDMLVIPKVSSETRKYIPICYVSPDVIVNGSALIVADANIYCFGVLISSVHMAWMRTVAGRMKSDYQYSGKVVYNNFPWPTPSFEQRKAIELTAKEILNARALYPDSCLADLYDPLTMPIELKKAHDANDKAVKKAYGYTNDMSETDIVAELMKLYQKLVFELKMQG